MSVVLTTRITVTVSHLLSPASFSSMDTWPWVNCGLSEKKWNIILFWKKQLVEVKLSKTAAKYEITWTDKIGCRRRQLIHCLLTIDNSDNLNSDKQRSRRIESCQCNWRFVVWDCSALKVDVISGKILWWGADDSVSWYKAGCGVSVSLPHDSNLTSRYRTVWGCRNRRDSDVFYSRAQLWSTTAHRE